VAPLETSKKGPVGYHLEKPEIEGYFVNTGENHRRENKKTPREDL